MLLQVLNSHHGILRTTALLELGLSRHRLNQALASGLIVQPRKGWIAVPNAAPELVFAAKHGVLLGCATQARRLGLWTRERDPQHYVVPRSGSLIRPKDATLHWGKPIVPREPWGLSDPVENVLNTVAHCFPHEEAVAVWDSALNKRLVDRPMLERLGFDGTALRVLEDAIPWADSGLETYVRLRLGRFGLRIVPQVWILGHTVDLLIEDFIVFQADGGHHVGAQRSSDIEHDAILSLHGYTIVRVSYVQLMHHWPEVQDRLLRAVAQGKPRASRT